MIQYYSGDKCDKGNIDLKNGKTHNDDNQSDMVGNQLIVDTYI